MNSPSSPSTWICNHTGQKVTVNAITDDKIYWEANQMKFVTDRTTFEQHYTRQ